MRRPRVVKNIAGGELTALKLADGLAARLTFVEPEEILAIYRDPDDDIVLATALTAAADMIVTGDKDLLVLQNYEGIAIVTPAEALRRISTPE